MERNDRKIMFVLPLICKQPTGGVKVVLDYANRLQSDGYEVSVVYAIVHPEKLLWITEDGFDTSMRATVSGLCKLGFRGWLRLAKWMISGKSDYSSRSWYNLNENVKEHFVISLNYTKKLDADIYIATACTTAPYVADYPSGKKKFYFIQEYENWVMNDKELNATYSLPLKKIVISRWLSNTLSRNRHDSTVVPNGFDDSQFYITTPIEKRNRFSVSVMYHIRPTKDFATSLKALKIVHDKYPQLTVKMFGVYDTEEKMPEWIDFHKSPTHEEHLAINNESSIYLASSVTEGWGLTIGEAMMCGQAVVCTAAEGFLEMAVNEENALVSPVRNSEMLANNIIRLIEDDDLRVKIARQGLDDIKKFTVDKSYAKFKEIVTL